MANHLPGWVLAGSHPNDYELGLVDDASRDGKRVAYLRCVADSPGGFGTVMQNVDASRFRGKRIRFRAFVRPDGVHQWAGLWMRVDEPDGLFSAFDNMQHRPLHGSRDWEQHHVVLDVGEGSAAIAFGVQLTGTGEVRFVDLDFEEVSPAVPITGSALPPEPQNLDFSAG